MTYVTYATTTRTRKLLLLNYAVFYLSNTFLFPQSVISLALACSLDVAISHSPLLSFLFLTFLFFYIDKTYKKVNDRKNKDYKSL